MSAARAAWAADLLHFWFHRLGQRQWFSRSDALDSALRRRFSRMLAMQAHRQPRHFLTDRQTARAAVLLFDQCPRNLHRDSPRAFATDALARAICRGAIARRWDLALSRSERQFLYMPMMHSERAADQRLALRLYAALGDSFVLDFARAHAAMILRFGRFPHRNATLGRKSTPAERRAIAAGHAW